MYSKNNKKMIIQKEQEKINYYGIKKFKVGTASVLIAAGFAFLGTNAFASDSQLSNTTVNLSSVEKNTNSESTGKNMDSISKLGNFDEKDKLETTTQPTRDEKTTQPAESAQPKVEKQVNKSELENSINRL